MQAVRTSTLSGDAASSAQVAAWDEFVLAQPRAHLLQLSRWGILKSRFGWEARIVTINDMDEIQAGALVLLRRLPFVAAKMAYLPMGAYISGSTSHERLWNAIRRKSRAAFLKIEPGAFAVGQAPDLAAMGFFRSPQTIQPAATIIIDIDADDEAIMRRMNQGTRRKIRKSLAGDILYKEGAEADLPEFNRLMQQTGARNEFGVHNAAYFAAVHELFMPERGSLLLAEHEGELLAAIMIFAVGETASYLYGASSRSKSNLYATYGIQWEAIQWAKRRGCRYYDLWGVPDHDETTLEAEFRNRSDGLWGVYGFKRGWGGEVKRTHGAWDLPWNPIVYKAYRAALKLRR